jgi:hypothetical protein
VVAGGKVNKGTASWFVSPESTILPDEYELDQLYVAKAKKIPPVAQLQVEHIGLKGA